MAIKILNPLINHVEGGGASFNIHYGLNPPEDTSMLWVETEKEVTATTIGIEAMHGGAELFEKGGVVSKNNACKGAQVGDKMYLFPYANNTTSSRVIKMYDPQTDLVSTLSASIPEPNYSQSIGVVGTKVYLIGGEKVTQKIVVFDTADNSVVTLTETFPVPIALAGVGAIDSTLYIFGGYSSGSRLDTIYKFNTETLEITKLNIAIPTACNSSATAVIGNKIYGFGGMDKNFARITTSWVFDTENETIAVIAPLNNQILWACGVVGNRIYLFGGLTSSNTAKCVEVYDTVNNTMTDLSATIVLPENTDYESATVDEIIYLMPRYNGTNIHAFAESGTELTSNTGYAQASLSANIFNLVNGDSIVRIGVAEVFVGDENNQAERVKAYLHNGTEWEEI